MVAGGPGWTQPIVPRPTRTPYLPRGTWLPLSLLTALALSYPHSEPTRGLRPLSGGPLHTVPAQPQPGGPFMTHPLKAQRWVICSQKVEGWSCSCAVAVGPPGGRAKGQFSTRLPSNLRGGPACGPQPRPSSRQPLATARASGLSSLPGDKDQAGRNLPVDHSSSRSTAFDVPRLAPRRHPHTFPWVPRSSPAPQPHSCTCWLRPGWGGGQGEVGPFPPPRCRMRTEGSPATPGRQPGPRGGIGSPLRGD